MKYGKYINKKGQALAIFVATAIIGFTLFVFLCMAIPEFKATTLELLSAIKW